MTQRKSAWWSAVGAAGAGLCSLWGCSSVPWGACRECQPPKVPTVSYKGFCDNWVTKSTAKRCANKDLSRCDETPSKDFREGFEQAYIDLAMGRPAIPPPVPPAKYWNAYYRSPAGCWEVEQWYAGYEAGLDWGPERGMTDAVRVGTAWQPCQGGDYGTDLYHSDGAAGPGCSTCNNGSPTGFVSAGDSRANTNPSDEAALGAGEQWSAAAPPHGFDPAAMTAASPPSLNASMNAPLDGESSPNATSMNATAVNAAAMNAAAMSTPSLAVYTMMVPPTGVAASQPDTMPVAAGPMIWVPGPVWSPTTTATGPLVPVSHTAPGGSAVSNGVALPANGLAVPQGWMVPQGNVMPVYGNWAVPPTSGWIGSATGVVPAVNAMPVVDPNGFLYQLPNGQPLSQPPGQPGMTDQRALQRQALLQELRSDDPASTRLPLR
jgi:hypothetical protein